jgi:hypothetical protein
MTTTYMTDASDPQLIRQFVRAFGHRPTPQELQRYQIARTRLSAHLPARIRRGAARMITRL